ncbi:HAD-IA family hydrolase [Gracilibacillus sp. JCM 18860]|uniref:HAD-IA family hydrolase n=1 Tax=Gracilibacillus sp. JCM 18860 TaxID=1306159 RepID=UPI0006CFAF8F
MDTIIFDVDDTLYDQLLPFKNTVKQQFQQDFIDAELEALYITSRKYSDEVFEKHMNGGEITALELQTYRITKACEEFGLAISYQDAVSFQQKYLQEQKQITLFEELKQLLDHLLSQKKQLAILTNGEEAHQMMKVKQLGLSHWIPATHIFVSGAIGHSKPSREVFRYMEDQLKLNKEKTVYIGDSYENDIVGAKQMGWQAIWMNHRKRTIDLPKWQPNYTAYHPKELVSWFLK